MFEDSLFASTARRSRRRGFAAVLSFALQAAVLGLFVLVPLIYTNALPLNLLKSNFIVNPPMRSAAPPGPQVRPRHPDSSNMEDNRIVTPIVIPPHAAIVHDEHPAADGGVSGPDIPGAIPFGEGANNHALDTILAARPAPVLPPPPAVTHGPYYISHIDEGLLVRKVTPAYPQLAVIARQQGSVILEATIARDGSIENLHVISGPPLLVEAAMSAVRRWRYRPYLLNNQPVEVETQITVNFNLGR